jgi:hypothetical protein
MEENRNDKFLFFMGRPEFNLKKCQMLRCDPLTPLDSSGNLIYKQLFNERKYGLEEDS